MRYAIRMQFIVLSSSRGTTFQSTLDRIADGSLTAKCLGLITDSPDRGCIEKAKAAGLPYLVVEKNPDEDREEYEKRLHEAILALTTSERKTKNEKRTNESPTPSTTSPNTEATVIACMGWMWIITPWFINQWPNKILNVHPALLPRHGGEGMYGHHVHDAVLKAGEKESGMTIHLMDEGVDTGKILLQKSCPVLPDDTAETLQAKVQELEKEWYPKALQMIEDGDVKL